MVGAEEVFEIIGELSVRLGRLAQSASANFEMCFASPAQDLYIHLFPFNSYFGGFMRAEILSCGTELLLGHITDTNATYLAQSLASLGIDLYFVSEVGDNQGRIVETLRRAWERSDMVIITGGLGPTEDDLARESMSALLGETMRVDPVLEAELRTMFARRAIIMPERNIKQATLIP